jgi:hypothetical protein
MTRSARLGTLALAAAGLVIAAFLLFRARREAVAPLLVSGAPAPGEARPQPETVARLAPRGARANPPASDARPDAAIFGEEGARIGGPDRVRGRILDPEGRPLGGIPLYVGLATSKSYRLPDQRVLWTDGPDIEGGRVVARRYSSDAVSDPEGRFDLDAWRTRNLSSGDGGVRVAPADPGWMEPSASRDSEGGDLRMDRAASLVVRLVDELSQPLPECWAFIRESSRRGENAILAKNGGFVVQWRRTEELPAVVQPSLVLWARGRAVERRSPTIPAEVSTSEITVTLRPLQADAALVLRGDDLGAKQEDKLLLVLSLPDWPDQEVLRVQAVPDDRGSARRASVPPGRFRVRVFGFSPAQREPLLDEVVALESGTEVERRLDGKR